jgi:hypothetical protein
LNQAFEGTPIAIAISGSTLPSDKWVRCGVAVRRARKPASGVSYSCNAAEKNLHSIDCMVDPDSGRYLSEDYAFCRRWRDMGGKIWVDLDCKLMHLGQHLFGGDLAESLRVQGRW